MMKRLVLSCVVLGTWTCGGSQGQVRRDEPVVVQTPPARGGDDEPGPSRDPNAPPRMLPFNAPEFSRDSAMQIHVLDVGQGAATLLEFPCAAILVDTGGEVNDKFDGVAALQKQLETFFARRSDLNRTIALLVLTHPHIDHVRGVPMVLREFTVLNVVDNGQKGGELVREPMDALRDFVAQGKVGHRSIITEDLQGNDGLTDAVVDPVACGGVDPRIRVLNGQHRADPGWGTSGYDKAHFANENNHSVVVRVDHGKASVLITGDLEAPAIATLLSRYSGSKVLDVDVYVVGHHGSANGTTRQLLDALTPRMALMNMGPFSRHVEWSAYQYGHPRAAVVDLLEDTPGMMRWRTREVEVGQGMKKFSPKTLKHAVMGTGWDGMFTVKATPQGQYAVTTTQKPTAGVLIVPGLGQTLASSAP